MKVFQIVSDICRESDGVAYCVRHLTRALLTEGCQTEIHALRTDEVGLSGIPIHTYERVDFPTPSLGVSPAMLRSLKSSATSADVIHAHSLWMYQTRYAWLAARHSGAALCITVHGTLSEWALRQSRWKKQLSLHLLGQRDALRHAGLLIATCSGEYEDIRRFGLKNPVAVIPNGVEIPSVPTVERSAESRDLVFLSRIHPKKGIDMLLRCWKRLEEHYPDWNLKIAGPLNTEYAKSMVAYSEELGCRRVSFVGELIGTEKYDFLSSAQCFVLPTHSENFGIAVAEALVCRTPVITTTGAPWGGLVDHHAGWWINPEESLLFDALHRALALSPSELHEMGCRGREWMQREYSWTVIAAKTQAAYAWLRDGGDKPDFIYLD